MLFPNVRLINDGQGVNEIYTNYPILDLIQRTDYLKKIIDNISGDFSKLIIHDVSCTDGCQDSNAVFFNEDVTVRKWDRALASMLHQGLYNQMELNPSVYIQGIIRNLRGSAGERKGDLYLSGLIENINVINLTMENEIRLGHPMYLNGTGNYPGKLTYTAPAVEIFCGKFVSSNNFLLTPDTRTLKERHRHIWTRLDYANFEQVGDPVDGHWLYPNTGDNFPIWPPLTFNSVMVCVNGVNYFPGAEHGNIVWLDAEGLHYLSPDYPINADLNIFDATMYYLAPYGTELDPETDGAGVYTLFPRTTNLSIFRQGTENFAASGHLDIASIPKFQTLSLVSGGHEVIKSLQSHPQTGVIEVTKGPVVERVRAGTANLKFTDYLDTFSDPAQETGILKLHVMNTFSYESSENEDGSLVWKDVTVESPSGNIEIKRGLVVESIDPVSDSRLQIFQQGTSTPATQGKLQIKIRDVWPVRFIYKDVKAGVAGRLLYDPSGTFSSDVLSGTGSIIRCYARMSDTTEVTAGSITITPYIDAVALTNLAVTLNTSYPTFREATRNVGVDTYTNLQKLTVQVTDSGGFTVTALPSPAYASLEVVIFIVRN